MFDISMTDTRLFLFDVWRIHRFNTAKLAISLDLPEGLILDMLRHQPVDRNSGLTVLAALSTILEQNISLDTVRVPPLLSSSDDSKTASPDQVKTHPTFRTVQERHGIKLSNISKWAKVHRSIALAMYRDEPVARESAVQVLTALCDMVGVNRSMYTVNTVNVKLTPPI